MMRYLPLFLYILAATSLWADVPMRDCTLKALISAVDLPTNKLTAYQQGNEVLLQAPGFLFPPDTDKSIEAEPTGDNSTPFRTAINYHRSLRNDGAASIASYWHPALQRSKTEQLAQPGVMANTKKDFAEIDHVELLGMLDLQNRQVVFLRYQGKTRAFVTIEQNGIYYLVSDPGLQVPIAIARAAFDSGSAEMAE